MIESSDIDPHSDAHLIYDKEGKNIQWRKHYLFNESFWENWTYKIMKLEQYLTPYTRYTQNLDIIRLLEENIGNTHCDINHSKIFSDPSVMIMKIKTKLNNGV